MEVEYNMYSFINHKSLSHLAIPYFYFVNNENIVKKLDSDCLYDPKCISDNLFDTLPEESMALTLKVCFPTECTR